MDVFNRSAAPGMLATYNDLAYCLDRWILLTQTAGIEVCRSNGHRARYAAMLKQTHGTAQRFGLAQLIESRRCQAYMGRELFLRAKVRANAAAVVKGALLSWNSGIDDSCPRELVSDWTNAEITNFFITTPLAIDAVQSCSLSANVWTEIEVDELMANDFDQIAVMFWTESAQPQNFTLEISEAELSVDLTDEYEPQAINEAQAECARYFRVEGSGMVGCWENSSSARIGCTFPVPMRAIVAPTLLNTAPTFEHIGSPKLGAGSWINTQTLDVSGVNVTIAGFSGATAGVATMPQTKRLLAFDAEIGVIN